MVDFSPESVAAGAAGDSKPDHDDEDGHTLKSAAMKELLRSVGYALGIRHEIEDHAADLCVKCFETVQRHCDEGDDD